MQHVIGGVTVTEDDIRQAIEILKADKSTNVKQPFKAKNHPLAQAEEGWYYKFADEEVAHYPDVQVPAGNPHEHAAHVKTVSAAPAGAGPARRRNLSPARCV